MKSRAEDREKTELGFFDDEFAHRGIVKTRPPKPGLIERTTGTLVSGALRCVGFPVEFLKHIEEPPSVKSRRS